MLSQVAMAEEFQVCSGNWWNSQRNLAGSSPCSWAVNDSSGNLGWPSNCHEPVILEMNNAVISSDDSDGSASDGSCTTLQDVPTKTQPQNSDRSLSIDCWNPEFLHESARPEENYSQIMNYRQENWINPKNFCDDLSTNPFKQVFSTQHQPVNSTANSIESCAATRGEISINFPLNSSSYSHTSSLMQNLLGQDNSQPHGSSFLDDQEMSYMSEPNYIMNSNELLLSSLPKSSSMVIQPSRQQQPANHSPFNNNTRFWNVTAPALRHDSSNFIPSTNSQILPSIHHNIRNNMIPNIRTVKHPQEAREVASSAAKKQNSTEPAFKLPRIETPSPLPTFKVRTEKLGDRITALQQLASPFGKTDTASVLHEAIDYIKFLHDQVKILSAPYFENGSPPLLQHQQVAGQRKDREGLNQDLKSRGLCLVPISNTFPVAAETTSDFTHTNGVSFSKGLMQLKPPPLCECGNGFMLLRRAGKFSTRPGHYHYICPAGLKHRNNNVEIVAGNKESSSKIETGSNCSENPYFFSTNRMHQQAHACHGSCSAQSSSLSYARTFDMKQHNQTKPAIASTVAGLLNDEVKCTALSREQVCCCFGCICALLCVLMFLMLVIVIST